MGCPGWASLASLPSWVTCYQTWSDSTMPFSVLTPLSPKLSLITLQGNRFGTSLLLLFCRDQVPVCTSLIQRYECLWTVTLIWVSDIVPVASAVPRPCLCTSLSVCCGLQTCGERDLVSCIYLCCCLPECVWDRCLKKQGERDDGKKSWLGDPVLSIWLQSKKMHRNRASRKATWKVFIPM